jgi:hypothetical protein
MSRVTEAVRELAPVIAREVRNVGAQSRVDTEKVTKEVAAVVINQTNQEPFYQSRVTIGAIMTLIGGTYALVLDFMDGVPPATDDLTAQATAIVGAAVVLYGRWVAKKPLGS